MEHTLLLSEADRWKLAYSYIRFKCGEDEIWREEDLPKLSPFFKYSKECRGDNFRPMTTEEQESFRYYDRCESMYADANATKRDAVLNISFDSLVRAFGYKIPSDEDDNGDEIDTEFGEDTPLESSLTLTYPCVCVTWIESCYDRTSGAVCGVDYVQLTEFKLESTTTP